jgi:hypothetical protein
MRSLDFSIDLILRAALWPVSKRNEYQESSGGGGGRRPGRNADNHTAIYDPIV